MEKSIISKILIIGGGLTGSVTASLIRHEAAADISIWEKEDHIGGRFATFRNPQEPKCSVDLGAQYISATLEFIRSHARFYDELLEKNLLVPLGQKIENFRKLSESKMNFIAPLGAESLVHHFVDKAEAKVCLNHNVLEINLKETNQWEVKAENGVVQDFDAVILTIPVPEVLKIEGNFLVNNQDDDIKMSMEQVKFSSRYAVGIMYNERVKSLEEFPWSVKYFPNDSSICFAAIDNRKRGQADDPPSILIHTTIKYSLLNMDKTEEEVQNDVFNHFKCLVPDLPEPSHIKSIKWIYSQVTEPYVDNPGCIVLNEHPCLICGGDSFTESDFNGCTTSALRIVEELLKHVTIAKSHKDQKKKSH